MTEELENLRKEVEFYKNLAEKRERLGLQWEKVREDVVSRLRTEFPVIKSIPEKDITTDETKPHILIEADNFDALTVLNYTHKERVDVIYIDPPFNTGARDWKYNNDYVDENHLYRHSRWLSFMENRLRVARDLLAPTGVICCAIDDYEAPRLWLMLEQIFGRTNFLGTAIVRTIPKGRNSKRKLHLQHEYAFFFGRTKKAQIHKIPMDPSEKSHKYALDLEWKTTNPDMPLSKPGMEPNPEQLWTKTILRKGGVDSDAKNPDGTYRTGWFPIFYDPDKPEYEQLDLEARGGTNEKEILPIADDGEERIWRRSKESILQLAREGKIWAEKVGSIYKIQWKY